MGSCNMTATVFHSQGCTNDILLCRHIWNTHQHHHLSPRNTRTTAIEVFLLNQSLGAEPAYIANEDTGLYSAIPEMSSSQNFNTMMQLPTANLSGGAYATNTQRYASNNVYSVIEGSPTYKQRRRRSSIPPGTNGVAGTTTPNTMPHAPHRQSATWP